MISARFIFKLVEFDLFKIRVIYFFPKTNYLLLVVKELFCCRTSCTICFMFI